MKKTRNLILLIVLLFAFIANTCAEIKPKKVTISETKGSKNTYVIENYERTSTFYLYNKQNYLIDTETAYLLCSVPPKLSLGNKYELTKLISKYLTPLFKAYKGNFTKYSNLRIYCYGNPTTGKVSEIYMYYPKELGIISAKVVEQFEKEVKNKIYLTYDKESSIFKKSTWIRQYVIYPPEIVKNME